MSPKSFYVALFVWTINLLFLNVLSATVCDNEDECAEDVIIDSNVYCRGFESCNGAKINATTMVSCGGQKGCQQTTIYTSSGSVYCDGWLGCWYADITVAEDTGVLECRGRRTCYNGIINAKEIEAICSGGYGCDNADISGKDVTCSGYYGCRSASITAASQLTVTGDFGADDADITRTPTITTNGYYGLNNAYISSDGISTLTLTSSGEYSLNGAELNCFSESSCTVTCGGDTSCNGFTFNCYDDATCSISCDDDCSDECPTITSLETSSSMKIHKKLKQQQQTPFGESENDQVQFNKENLFVDGKHSDMDYAYWLLIGVKVLLGLFIYEILIRRLICVIYKNTNNNDKKFKYQDIGDSSHDENQKFVAI